MTALERRSRSNVNGRAAASVRRALLFFRRNITPVMDIHFALYSIGMPIAEYFAGSVRNV